MEQEEFCLVTGSCGFVGSHMVEILLKNGYRVRATDLAGSDTTVFKNLNIEFIPSDNTQKETLEKLFHDVKYVFHLAAIFHFSTPWDEIYKVNVEGTRNLLDIAKNYNLKRFVNWSTTGIYGLPKIKPVTEETKENPGNNYEKSKWLQEEVVREYHKKYNIPITIVRPVPIYGPRSKYALGQLIMLYAKGQIQATSVFAKSKFPAVHVRDVCNATLFLSQKEEAIGEAYNIVDDQTLTVREVAEVIGKEVGTKIFTVHVPMVLIKYLGIMTAKWSAFEAKYILKQKTPKIELDPLLYISCDYLFSNEKLKKLGYKFLYPDTKTGLIETIKWYKEQGFIPNLVAS